MPLVKVENAKMYKHIVDKSFSILIIDKKRFTINRNVFNTD